MQKVDLVIILLGVVALAATVAGVLYYDEVVGNSELTFVETATPVSDSLSMGDGGTQELIITAPHNATRATFTVDVTFSGQALNPSGGSVTVEIMGPDGSVSDAKSVAMGLDPGATSGSWQVEVDHAWLPVPNNTVADEDTFDATHDWMGANVTVRVIVEAPSEQIPFGSNYAFAAAIEGDIFAYQHTTKTPEPRVV